MGRRNHTCSHIPNKGCPEIQIKPLVCTDGSRRVVGMGKGRWNLNMGMENLGEVIYECMFVSVHVLEDFGICS